MGEGNGPIAPPNYSDRSIVTGSIRTARITAGSAATNATAQLVG